MGLFKRHLQAATPTPEAQPRPGILLVDHEERNLEVLGSLLTAHYDVQSARSAIEALQLLKSMATTDMPHVLISGQRMPRMTGTELFSQVKKLWPDIRCILITGYIAEVIKQPDTAANNFRLLCKPIEGRELLRVITEEVARR